MGKTENNINHHFASLGSSHKLTSKLINNKTHSNNMIKQFKVMFIFMMTITLFSFMNVNSVSLVNYPIDEGFGGVIFDTVNVGMSGVSSRPKDTFWSPISRHGLYSVYPKPGKFINVLIPNYPALTPQTNFTLELEYMPSNLILGTPISKLGTYSFSVNGATQTGTLTFNTGLIVNTVPIFNITPGKLNSLFLTWNGTHYDVYSNNISQTPLGIPQILPLAITINPLNLFNLNFDGVIDEFEIYNFSSNQAMINSLYTGTTTFVNNGNATIPIINQLIKNNSPNINTTFMENVDFGVRLNQIGTCNLYVDNNFKKTYSNILTMTDRISFNNNYGNHSYFFNCFNTNFNELTNDTLFTVKKTPNTQINFNFIGTDFVASSKPLEVVSPCLKSGVHIPFVNTEFSSSANPRGAQFKDVQNGQATMTLQAGTHEFCLIHGLVSYDSYNKTVNYNPLKIYNQIKLGDFDLPNNLSTSYTFTLDNFDIYGKTDPKAWGTSWVALISSIIGLLLGLGLVGLGVTTKSPQLAVMGALLLMFSLGYQVTNLVMGVLL